MAEPLELLVDDVRHAGFQRGAVTQVFEAALTSTTWQVSYSARADDSAERVLIEAGDAVTLRVGDEDLVRGYVIDDRVSYSAQRRELSVSGSSRIQDLLDCSAICRSRQLRDRTVFQIAQTLTNGYEIAIIDGSGDRGAESIERFAIQEGESIADALGRAARLRGLVLQDVAGDLVIGRVGAQRTRTVIERGRNVLTGDRVRSWRERYSEYRFRGQTRTTDEAYGEDALHIGKRVEDPGVTRLRRLVVHTHTDRREDIGRRAALERNMRAGRSERLIYEVPGWRTDEGELWRPNTVVRVVDDWLEVEADLLIVRVTHAFEPNRYRTTLELTRPEAFAELDYPLRPRGARWR